MRRVRMLFLVVLCFSLVALPALAQNAAEEPKVLGEGDDFVNFTLDNPISGTSVSFDKDVKGAAKLTAIVFMNTACTNCIKELKLMNSLAGEMKDLAVYAILVDQRGAEAAKSYEQAYKLANVKYLIDPEFKQPPLYGFSYTPAMVMVDKKGTIVYSKGGYTSNQAESVKESVKKLL